MDPETMALIRAMAEEMAKRHNEAASSGDFGVAGWMVMVAMLAASIAFIYHQARMSARRWTEFQAQMIGTPEKPGLFERTISTLRDVEAAKRELRTAIEGMTREVRDQHEKDRAVMHQVREHLEDEKKGGAK